MDATLANLTEEFIRGMDGYVDIDDSSDAATSAVLSFGGSARECMFGYRRQYCVQTLIIVARMREDHFNELAELAAADGKMLLGKIEFMPGTGSLIWRYDMLTATDAHEERMAHWALYAAAEITYLDNLHTLVLMDRTFKEKLRLLEKIEYGIEDGHG